jgi:flagellin-like hook-associated protein FlgL
VNLLDSDKLSVQFNENGSSKLDITGADMSSSGLSIDASTLDTDANIDAAMKSLKAATDTIRSQSSSFGSNLSVVQNRQDFTKGMIETLQAGSDALVIADPNEEGANLLALNTRAQIAQTTLSMASQSDSAVMRLLQ